MTEKLTIIITELDNAEIRRTSDGRCSVYDLIQVVTGKRNPRQAWNNLAEAYPEVVQKCDNFKFPGQGQKETPITDKKGWAHILGLLPGIAGKNYRTEAADLVIRYLDADVAIAESIVDRTNDEEGLNHLEARIKSRRTRNYHTRTLCSRGVAGRGYAICTNKTYSGLYGTNAAGLRKRKGLPKKANVRDNMNTSELVEVSFSEDLSSRKIIQEDAYGTKECGAINYKTGKRVADFIRETLAS
jgi:hypothetical protein